MRGNRRLLSGLGTRRLPHYRLRRKGRVLPKGAGQALAGRAADGRRSPFDGIIEAALEADIWTAGFPCQDISPRGPNSGLSGARSGLWSQIRRAVGLARPPVVILENVANLRSGGRGAWFGTILGDLAALGYDVEWHCIPAAIFGASHRRDRMWIVAYQEVPNAPRVLGSEVFRGTKNGVLQSDWGMDWRTALEQVRGMDDGLSSPVDRLRALGNAIVPQAAEMMGIAIKRWANAMTEQEKFTEIYNVTNEQQAKTHAGMMHWAGTGPKGRTCRECGHWRGSSDNRYAGSGELKPAPCGLYAQRMQNKPPKVPHGARACKYFGEAAVILKKFDKRSWR